MFFFIIFISPSNLGLIDPATSDGRVIFVLPWEGSTIAGTTDEPTELSYNPQTSSAEVDWILKEVNKLMNDGTQIQSSRND